MLLLLLLQQDEPRVVIDALLRMDRKSAASIAREAQVESANLSRLRQVAGEGQISADGQGRLLRALGWSYGVPDIDRAHTWVIDDDESVKAAEWILKEKLKGKALLRRVGITGQAFATNGPYAWAGKLDAAGAYCTIVVRGLVAGSQNFSDQCRKKLNPIKVSKNAYDLLLQNKLDEKTLKELADGKVPTVEFPDIAEQYSQLVGLGLSPDHYQSLLMQWLSEQARRDPNSLEIKLRNLEKLTLHGKTIYPKGLTDRQREKFVFNLASAL